MTETAQKKLTLSKSDRIKVWWRSTFLQGSWNYERMQNGGWAYSLIPALRKLYPEKKDLSLALKRHLEFFNTHPYLASPIIGVTLALEEEKANGAQVENTAIQGVKVGMMGPLAGVGDPAFWFTMRPILGALGASFALSGNILGPILFFVLWNVIRFAFMWYTQEFGYKVGTSITKDLSGGLLGKITQGASILGMFVIGGLVQRWVSITLTPVVSTVANDEVNIIDFSQFDGTGESLQTILREYDSGKFLYDTSSTTLQDNLNSLTPGLLAVLLTLFICWLLKKNISPIVIIIGLFIVGIIGVLCGFM